MSKYLNLSENELVQKIKKKDPRALEEVYDRYSSLLYSLIKKIITDDKNSNEILTKVFLILWNKIDAYPEQTRNLFVWLINITRNLAIDHLRRKLSPTEINDYNNEYEDKFIIPILDLKIDPLDLKTAMVIKPKLDEALNKLTDIQKQIIHLSFYEGFTVDEISEKLFIPLEKTRQLVADSVFDLRNNLLSEE